MIDIYATVTDRVLAQLKAGVVPWRKTWRTGLPKSLGTGKEYRGINILLLSTTAHTSRYWTTYLEAKRLGGHVRKGEKATPVIYWKWRTQEDFEKLKLRTGKEEFAPCVPFISAVFNLDQVDGVTRPDDDARLAGSNPLEVAGKVFEVMPDKPEIEHSATHHPAYIPALDRVTLPHLSQFENAAHYYATLFHELVHSSGHAKRLNRFKDAERDCTVNYSFEELVAEFGAAFLCGFAGIESPETNALQASYIEAWARVIQQDNRLLLRAASAAQRAVDYVRGKVVTNDDVSIAA